MFGGSALCFSSPAPSNFSNFYYTPFVIALICGQFCGYTWSGFTTSIMKIPIMSFLCKQFLKLPGNPCCTIFVFFCCGFSKIKTPNCSKGIIWLTVVALNALHTFWKRCREVCQQKHYWGLKHSCSLHFDQTV